MIQCCINAAELRRALAEIEAAERNGFAYCLAVFKLTTVGPMLNDHQLAYSDLIERAHPTDPTLDWGRFQNITKRCRFIDGRLDPFN